MNATELRIGNLVELTNIEYGTNKTPYEIDIDDFNDLYHKRIKINPIPITPEWLERAGFSKRLINNKFYEYFIDATPLNYKNDYVIKWWDTDFDRKINFAPVLSGTVHAFPCDYIHQLQNLYFALTGKELEFNVRRPQM